MSEWDNFETEQQNTDGNVKGNWDVLMTLAALAATSAAAFLMAYLTKDIPTRPIWLLAICFAAPVAALMLAVFLKEKVSSSMTPSTSRKAQFLLAGSCVLAAALIGCFCQVTNHEAKETRVETEGWNDLLIVLDKSGSMTGNYNKAATNAVISLLNKMDDHSQVAMLIDVDWQTSLDSRKIDLGPLSQQRDELIQLAQHKTSGTSDFTKAFQTVQNMLKNYHSEGKNISVLLVSDGIDITGKFRANDFSQWFKDREVKVNYLYVDPKYEKEVEKLALSTKGSSIDVSNLDQITNQMQKLVQVTTYEVIHKDALRDIRDSDSAKTVVGILFALMGVLLGVSLTVMFSLQGQKRFQLILSPLMAILSFVILAFGHQTISVPWIREGIAFSLLGIVIMRSNKGYGYRARTNPISPSNAKESNGGNVDDGEW